MNLPYKDQGKLFSNKLNIPVFNQKAIKVAHMYLNSLALGIKHQIGKSFMVK